MRLLGKRWRFRVPAVVATVVVVAVLAWIVPKNRLPQRTGLAIVKGTSQEAAFSVASDFRKGPLLVPARGVGRFDVAEGFTVPQSFVVTVMAPNDRVLFWGNLNPGVDCWASLRWDGSIPLLEAYKVCT